MRELAARSSHPVAAPLLVPAALASGATAAPGMISGAATSMARGFTRDLHTNVSGLVLFSVLTVGICWPSHKAQCQEIAVQAGIYLFASSKAKPTAPAATTTTAVI